MYAYFRGTLAAVSENSVIVEVGGIGYRIFVSATTANALPMVGEQVKIYTYTSVKEDDLSLYGFLQQNELDLFKLLIGVNGIGPKGALSILSVLEANEVIYAIASSDAKMISKAPGIGAKTAQRVVLELKDKVSLEEALSSRFEGTESTPQTAGLSDAKKETVEALTALGYGSAEALRAVTQVEGHGEMDTEQLLKASLKYLL